MDVESQFGFTRRRRIKIQIRSSTCAFLWVGIDTKRDCKSYLMYLAPQFIPAISSSPRCYLFHTSRIILGKPSSLFLPLRVLKGDVEKLNGAYRISTRDLIPSRFGPPSAHGQCMSLEMQMANRIIIHKWNKKEVFVVIIKLCCSQNWVPAV